MTNNKKYQVFVSSTYKDLIDTRNRIIDVILDLYHFPVGMEMFGADDSEQWDFIKDTINVSDYYILILGHRYGTVDSDGVGFTEKEYDYAKSRGIPILAFIRNSNVSTMPHEREDDINQNKRLEEFRNKATANKLCKFWSTIDELEREVALSLPKCMSRHPMIGWVRADQIVTPELTQEMVKLSEENRRLREENEHFRELYNSRNPQICVEINRLNNISFTLPNVPSSFFLTKLMPIDLLSIPKNLLPFIDNEYLSSYNDSLPDEKNIEQHNNAVQQLFFIDNLLNFIEISILNSGSSKANDVRVDIKFPDFVKVIESDKYGDDLDRLKKKLESEKTFIKKSPLLIAEERFKKEQERTISARTKISAHQAIWGNMATVMAASHSIPKSLLHIANANYNLRVEADNNISIWLRSLLQTRETVFDDEVSLFPLSEGVGVVEIKIICEEYSEATIVQVPIQVIRE